MYESHEDVLLLGYLSQQELASLEQLRAALQLWDEYHWTTVTADMVSKHLQYLKNRGLIDWQRDRDSGKRVHKITQKGRKELADWVCSSSIPASPFIFSFDLIRNALNVVHHSKSNSPS